MIHRTNTGVRLRGVCALAILLGLLGRQPRLVSPAAEFPEQQASLTLDHVDISLSTTLLPNIQFTTSEPGSASQVATAVGWQPFRELTITAIPFGTRPGTEAVPVAQPGGAPAYYSALRRVRLAQSGTSRSGPRANLFGQMVPGQATVVNLNLDGPVLKPTLIVEWVVEAGPRLWIVRASQEQTTGTANALSPSALSSIGQLVLTSHTLDQPSTVGSTPNLPHGGTVALAPSAGNLPYPNWWSGDCDSGTYLAGSNGLSAHRLGAVYLGMPACGPRPFADNAPDVLVRFFPGAWGELEWECVELSMRFLYLAYGIHPYEANGNTVVWHYSSAADGGSLQKVGNGTLNAAPQPGDVLSYDGSSTVGHTSVVMSSSVDGAGDGTITVIEQNSNPSGSTTMNVAGWHVKGNPGSVSGWLHNPGKLPVRAFLPFILR